MDHPIVVYTSHIESIQEKRKSLNKQLHNIKKNYKSKVNKIKIKILRTLNDKNKMLASTTDKKIKKINTDIFDIKLAHLCLHLLDKNEKFEKTSFRLEKYIIKANHSITALNNVLRRKYFGFSIHDQQT